jgi:putative transposase
MNRPFYLPRLPREYYQADAILHWTMPIEHRAQGWLDQQFHVVFREMIHHAAAREGLLCPTYCLMPDHIHFVWTELRQDSDQLNAMAFLRTHLERTLAPQRFQHQAHDRVLKEKERARGAFPAVCWYILENPSRAGLIKNPREWPYSAAVLPGYPRLDPRESEFWPKF